MRTQTLLATFSVATSTFASSISTQLLRDRALDPAISGHLPGSWTYIGCYGDHVIHRALSNSYTDNELMTGEDCISFCDSQGYPVAGTEYSSQCFCGISSTALVKYTDSDCGMRCAGDPSQACGGPDRLSVYSNGLPGPMINLGDEGIFKYMGCWADSVQKRVLPIGVQVPGGSAMMTVKKCIAECRANGFDHAGLEYAGECWCGEDTANKQQIYGPPEISGCDLPCHGNASEYCGGSNRMNVYFLPRSLASELSSSTPVTSIELSTAASSSTLSSGSLTTTISTGPTTPTPSSTTPSAAPTPREIIVNGDFELPSGPDDHWDITPNPSVDDHNLIASIDIETQYSHSGSQATYVRETNDSDNGTRSLCLSQSAYHPGAGLYNISAYIGRIAFGDGPNGAGASTDDLYYKVLVDGGKLADGAVCNPSQGECDIAASNGALTYQRKEWQVLLPEAGVGFHTLSICITFIGKNTANPDIFILDDVSSIGPS